MGTILFIVAGMFVLLVIVGTFKSIFSLEFPGFVKPLDAGTRDAYLTLSAFAVACVVLALWKTDKLTSFEIAGIKGEVQRIDQKVASLQGQVVDLGKGELRAEKITTTGPGPSLISMAHIGCPPFPPQGSKVTYCAEGSPLSLFQITTTGEKRPVSSLSAVGFQDLSTAAKPTCSAANRGTFYVEKGVTNVPDKPFLCAKGSNNAYAWIQMAGAP